MTFLTKRFNYILLVFILALVISLVIGGIFLAPVVANAQTISPLCWGDVEPNPQSTASVPILENAQVLDCCFMIFTFRGDNLHYSRVAVRVNGEIAHVSWDCCIHLWGGRLYLQICILKCGFFATNNVYHLQFQFEDSNGRFGQMSTPVEISVCTKDWVATVHGGLQTIEPPACLEPETGECEAYEYENYEAMQRHMAIEWLGENWWWLSLVIIALLAGIVFGALKKRGKIVW